MVAALIPFATTDLINVRQFGVGVAVAILLDVLIVRPVLLPAAEAVLGRFGWWPTRTAPSRRPPARPRPPQSKARRHRHSRTCPTGTRARPTSRSSAMNP